MTLEILQSRAEAFRAEIAKTVHGQEEVSLRLI